MLWMVMFGFSFWKVATSSFHSLYCTGEAGGGAQLTLIVTWPPEALGALLVLLELQPAAASAMAAMASGTALRCVMRRFPPEGARSLANLVAITVTFRPQYRNKPRVNA